MSIIVTYDVPSRHTELKDALFAAGYSDGFTYQGQTVQLPNTTVFHPRQTPQGAVNDVQAVCRRLNITLDRCIAVELEGPNWFAIPGIPFR